MKKPCAGIDDDDYNEMHKKMSKTLTWMYSIGLCISTIGLVVVFGIYRKLTKPTFVKVICAFITLGILSRITYWVLYSEKI